MPLAPVFAMKSRWLAAVAFLIAGCGTDVPGNPEDYDVVVTSPDTTFDFAQVTTYTVPTSVPVITSIPSPIPTASPSPEATAAPVEEPSPLPTASPSPTPTPTETSIYSAVILQSIQDQMNARGYQLVTDPDAPAPDLFVEAATMATTETQVYYDYWYSYWGAYYTPWYGSSIGVGWAPVSTPYVVTSTVGSVIINVTDPSRLDPATQRIPTVWVGVLNGYVTTPVDAAATDPTVVTRIQQGIQQAYEQSPYFQKGSP